ncbi:MAG: ATPase domain-containing protein [Candidatus Micrarchaeia archaeon]|jgi:circadian clock protein KaiC
MTSVERVGTGIPGLDALVEGGLPKNSVVLITGAPGTGKSLLCTQILANGCKQGENTLYVSLEQMQKDILAQSKPFNWDVEKHVSEGRLSILEIGLLSDVDVLGQIDQLVKEKKITRIVIDSLTALQNYPTLIRNIKVMQQVRSFEVEMQLNLFSPETRMRLLIHHLIRFLKSLENTTSLLISDVDANSNNLSKDGISEFLCDGVIMLSALSVADTLNRTIEVKKMRYTKMQGGIRSCEITDTGITVE